MQGRMTVWECCRHALEKGCFLSMYHDSFSITIAWRSSYSVRSNLGTLHILSWAILQKLGTRFRQAPLRFITHNANAEGDRQVGRRKMAEQRTRPWPNRPVANSSVVPVWNRNYFFLKIQNRGPRFRILHFSQKRGFFKKCHWRIGHWSNNKRNRH